MWRDSAVAITSPAYLLLVEYQRAFISFNFSGIFRPFPLSRYFWYDILGSHGKS